MTISEPQQASLDEAYQSLRAAVMEVLLSINTADWLSIKRQLESSQLMELFGLPLERSDQNARAVSIPARALHVQEHGSIWERLPEVAKAIKNLDQHAAVADMPAWQNIRQAFTNGQQFGMRFF
ncbi:hypothetical protein ACWDRB_62460 [Nonomuraea sp. NPDC003707]